MRKTNIKCIIPCVSSCLTPDAIVDDEFLKFKRLPFDSWLTVPSLLRKAETRVESTQTALS